MLRKTIAPCFALVAFSLSSSAVAQVVLDDPLNGSTVGVRDGGQFVSGGWQAPGQISWGLGSSHHRGRHVRGGDQLESRRHELPASPRQTAHHQHVPVVARFTPTAPTLRRPRLDFSTSAPARPTTTSSSSCRPCRALTHLRMGGMRLVCPATRDLSIPLRPTN